MLKKIVSLLLNTALVCNLAAADYGRTLDLKKVDAMPEGAMSAVIAGNTLWVGATRGTIYGFDLSDPTRPRLISKIKALNHCRQLAAADGRLVATARTGGLAIFDVSNPQRPQLLGRHQTIELATGAGLSGHYAFSGNRIYGVEIIDIADPARPRFVSCLPSAEAQSVSISGDRLYVGDWGTGEVLIADWSNPARPRKLGTVRLDGFGDGIAVRDNLLFAATGHNSRSGPKSERIGRGHGLEIWDVADPNRPRKLAGLKFPRFYALGNDFWLVRLAGDHAFVADTYNGVYAIDISDPVHPRCTASARLPELPSRYRNWERKIITGPLPDAVSGLAVGNGVVYVTGVRSGLFLAELPEAVPAPPGREPATGPGPAAPALPAGHPKFDIWHTPAMVREVAVNGDLAYAANSEDGVSVFRNRDGRLEKAGEISNVFAFDVEVRGNRLYVAENLGGLGVYELNEAGLPGREIGRFRLKDEAVQRIWAPRNTDLAVVSGHGGRIYFLNVADPARIRQVFTHRQVGIVYGDLMSADAVGGFLFFNWHNSGYTWYDLTGPVPRESTADRRPRFNSQNNGSCPFGNRMLIVLNGGLALVEANRTVGKAVTVPGIRLEGIPSSDQNLVAIAHRRSGRVTVLDLSDEASPQLVPERSLTLPGHPGRAAFWGGKLLIPGGYAGLWLEK